MKMSKEKIVILMSKENKEKIINLFENIKKHFDDTDANDKLVIDYIDNGICAHVYHNSRKYSNPILGQFTSDLTVQSLDDDGYSFMIIVYGNNHKKTTSLIKKTPDFDEMIHLIKGFYNWD